MDHGLSIIVGHNDTRALREPNRRTRWPGGRAFTKVDKITF
jgi:hypothetical protein